jgi:hypothetical protein
MAYSGKSVPIFAWKTDGSPVPLLTGDCVGERAGDQAFVDGRAMHWDGREWVLSLWKDFATWRRDEHYASAVHQHELVLRDSVGIDDEINLDELEHDLRRAAGRTHEPGPDVDERALRGASAS